MSSFLYQAIDREGVSRAGTIDAASLSDGAAALAERDLDVVRIESAEVASSSGRPVGREPRSEPPGAMPQAPPRAMPPGVTGAPGGNFLLVFGGIFAGVASILIVAGLGVFFTAGESGGLVMAGVPLIHLFIGLGAIWYGLHNRHRRRHLAVNGVATVATALNAPWSFGCSVVQPVGRSGSGGVPRATSTVGRCVGPV